VLWARSEVEEAAARRREMPKLPNLKIMAAVLRVAVRDGERRRVQWNSGVVWIWMLQVETRWQNRAIGR